MGYLPYYYMGYLGKIWQKLMPIMKQATWPLFMPFRWRAWFICWLH